MVTGFSSLNIETHGGSGSSFVSLRGQGQWLLGPHITCGFVVSKYNYAKKISVFRPSLAKNNNHWYI